MTQLKRPGDPIQFKTDFTAKTSTSYHRLILIIAKVNIYLSRYGPGGVQATRDSCRFIFSFQAL